MKKMFAFLFLIGISFFCYSQEFNCDLIESNFTSNLSFFTKKENKLPKKIQNYDYIHWNDERVIKILKMHDSIYGFNLTKLTLNDSNNLNNCDFIKNHQPKSKKNNYIEFTYSNPIQIPETNYFLLIREVRLYTKNWNESFNIGLEFFWYKRKDNEYLLQYWLPEY